MKNLVLRRLVSILACLFIAWESRGDLSADTVVADELKTASIGPDAAAPGPVLMPDGLSLRGKLSVDNAGTLLDGIVYLKRLGDVPMAGFTNMPGDSTSSPDAPSWWEDRGVVVTNGACDYAAAVQGQVKWMARQASMEFHSRLERVGGMGGAVSNLTVSFSLTNNSLPVTLGQLKNAAKPFYDRLAEVGIATNYPWSGTPADSALANIGQVKFLFSFDFDRDSDGDGMPDGWEVAYELNPLDASDGQTDRDRDGLLNAHEFGLSTDPTLKDSDSDGMGDLMEIQLGFDPSVPDENFPDSDLDGLDDFEELIWGTDPDKTDTDDDGLNDYKEIYDNFYHGQSHTNETVNGVFVYGTDPTIDDCDGDGLNDGTELKYGTDPWNTDSDGDGLPDMQEAETYYIIHWRGINASTVSDEQFFALTNAVSLDCLTSGGHDTAIKWQNGVVAVVQNFEEGRLYYEPSGFVTNVLCYAIGGQHVSVAISDGRLLSWEYYLGSTNTTLLDLLEFSSPVKAVECGEEHSVVLLDDGTVRTRFYGSDYHSVVTNQPSGITGAVAVAAGKYHSLALLSNGSVIAWGYNNSSYLPTNVPSYVTNAAAVAAGSTHSAALQKDGHVCVWGVGNDGNKISYNAQFITNAVEIVCGYDNCMAVLAGRTNVVAWGKNFGSASSLYKTNLTFNVPVRSIRAGYYGAVILENGQTVMLGMYQPSYLRVKDAVLISNGEASALAATNPLNSDTDGDGLKDGWELRFGFNPLFPRETNISDQVYWDPDADGLSNLQEYLYGTNPTSADGDRDGLTDSEEHEAHSDAFNPDSDGDGLLDGDEVKRYGSSPVLRDTDGDGLPDADESLRYGTSPSLADTDGDRLSDAEEVFEHGTDPTKADTDGDLLPDGWEVSLGTDPLDPDDGDADLDFDGMPDYWEILYFGNTDGLASAQSDGDGIADLGEYLAGTDPTNALSFVSGLPLGWLSRELGTPSRIGGASCTGGTFTLVGGCPPDASSDGYRICWHPTCGNFIFTARIGTVSDGVCGIFVRGSDDPGAAKIELMFDPAGGGTVKSVVRLNPSSPAVSSNLVPAASVWLRIKRSGVMSSTKSGGDYTFYCSTNGGASWSPVGSISGFSGFGADTLVGLFARSSQPESLCSGEFSDVGFSYSSSNGYAPFEMASDTGALFVSTNVVTVQPLATGLTFKVATTTNASASGWSVARLVADLTPFAVTSTAPAFVRVEAKRSGSFDLTYSSRFVSNRHLNGWIAQYCLLDENVWPAFSSAGAAWVSHLPSEDYGQGGGVVGGFWANRVAVRLRTILAVPCTLDSYDSINKFVFKIESVGSVKAELVQGNSTNQLLDVSDSTSWGIHVLTNTAVKVGLNTLTVDLKSWDGPAGVRLWWRPIYDPEFRRIQPEDCFVVDADRNGYADEAESWLDDYYGLSAGEDADGDGLTDLEETTFWYSNALDPASVPQQPAAGVSFGDTVPGLVACGFYGTNVSCPRLYDRPYPRSVMAHNGVVNLSADADFVPFTQSLPSRSEPFGLSFEGFFLAEKDGWYTFGVTADDRAVLELDGIQTVTVASPGSRSGGICLLAGLHPLRLVFEDRGGTRSLALSYSTPAGASGLLPGRLLRRRADALAAAQNILDADGDGIPVSVPGENDGEPAVGADTDGDGVPDDVERVFTLTDPFSPDISGEPAWQTVVPGETGSAVSGEWFPDGGGLYCASRNGAAEFSFTAVANGFYWIDLCGREFSEYAESRPFLVELSVDGASCGQRAFSVPVGAVGTNRYYTSFLTAGTHAVTVRWMNTLERHSLLIERLVVTLPGGADADADGLADWSVARLEKLLDIEAPSRSHTSPVCLEGSEAGCMEAVVLGGYPVPESEPGWEPEKRRLPGNAWYADVPLSPDGVTAVTAGFDGAAVAATCSVEWVALNLAACRTVAARRGDTLKFCLSPVGDGPVMASAGTNLITFTVGTNAQDLATNVVAVAATNVSAFLTFDSAGPHTLRAAWSDGGETYAFETRVDVAAVEFPRDPLLIVGKKSPWTASELSSGLWIESDGHLALEWNRNGGLDATLLEDRTAYVSARLSEAGPVLASARADAFSFTSHNEAGYMRYLYTLPDGTRVFEGRVSVQNLEPDLTLTIRFLSSRNYLANGLQSMTFTAEDFDENGELVITMYVTGSSFCHVQTFSQGGTVITTY